MIIYFKFERETKNTIRYHEEGSEASHAVGVLYVKKVALPPIVIPPTASKTSEGWPQRLKVEVSFEP